jgi:thiamine biosynthesis protein ThiI
MKFISLLSSGIDSPVATYLMSKKAEEIIIIHADGRPFTDDREIDNFLSIALHLRKQVPCNIKTYVVNHGDALSLYRKYGNKRYTCVFCKRLILRYAEELAKKEKAEAIIMGDSLGQVASQTLQNMKVIEQVINLPILRPLIGLDKEDIICIAKEIGTYDLSIMPSLGCNAVPKKPATKTKLEDILSEEKKIDVEDLVKNAVSKVELIIF